MTRILIDLNNENFQNTLFNLEKLEQHALFNSLKKIRQLNWDELYRNKGIRWESITSYKTVKENKIYSFRFSQKYRGTAYREGNYLVLLALFIDHDSTYKR